MSISSSMLSAEAIVEVISQGSVSGKFWAGERQWMLTTR